MEKYTSNRLKFGPLDSKARERVARALTSDSVDAARLIVFALSECGTFSDLAGRIASGNRYNVLSALLTITPVEGHQGIIEAWGEGYPLREVHEKGEG